MDCIPETNKIKCLKIQKKFSLNRNIVLRIKRKEQIGEMLWRIISRLGSGFRLFPLCPFTNFLNSPCIDFNLQSAHS